MLKEIHHRVKNNMQMISTLFDLQLKYGGDQDPPTLFRNCHNRIRSMALIHESLYHTDNPGQHQFQLIPPEAGKPFAEFLRLERPGHQNRGCRRRTPPGHQPGGAGRPGRQRDHRQLPEACLPGTKARRDPHQPRLVEIKDNGIGLSREFSLEKPTTFGWLMITNLMKQLEGTITVASDGGTTYRMIF